MPDSPGYSPVRKKLLLLLLLALVIPPERALSFYELKQSENTLDARGLLRGFVIATNNPEHQYFYEDSSITGVAGLARLIVTGSRGAQWGYELNAYQTYIPTDLVANQFRFGTPLDVERSELPEHSFSDDNYVHFAIDRINLRFSYENMDVTLGRQPVNLATTFYFTPNDFFAPFAATTFYRVYKPGVDALRLNYQVNELSQIAAIGVLGYEPDLQSETGWSRNPDLQRNSYLARLSLAMGGADWTVLAGQVRDTKIYGTALQGEWFDWLGMRMEGHIGEPNGIGERYANWAAGLEHRWPNSLNARIEWFYQSQGASSLDDYVQSAALAAESQVYLARNYAALGLDYEWTPLLQVGVLTLVNMIDHSSLFAINGIYSLSDETELALAIGLPYGDKPEGPQLGSEFGTYPRSLNIEVRTYF
ncbi:MAG: hypothetical protein OEY67_01210 [Gammaproteobacteria bacterium]|nr:hypothetical protein [Gammaproteobacteria bacterium]